MLDLTSLAKGKLNITWNDPGTDARLGAIINDAVPAVANMVGLTMDYDTTTVYDETGEEFDFENPSMERNILLNYIAYEWNHQAEQFRTNYRQDIAACRQKHALLMAGQEEEDDAGE